MKKTIRLLFLCVLTLLLLAGCSSKGISGSSEKVRIRLQGQVAPFSAILANEKDAMVVDPAKVTSLHISSPSNEDLEALKYFVNLKFLRIDNYMDNGSREPLDLSPLQNLPLVGLSLAGFNAAKPLSLASLAPVGSIKTLAILDLEHCQVTSVKPLSGLTGLRRLSIKDGSGVRIGDLDSLSNILNMGVMSSEIEEAKEWNFGPYRDGEPLLGLLVSNGNSPSEVEAVMDAIADKRISGPDPGHTDAPEPSVTETTAPAATEPATEITEPPADTAELYYYVEYETVTIAPNGEALITLYLEAYDHMGNLAWVTSWNNLRSTELMIASKTVAVGGKLFKEVTGELYCLDAVTGKRLWNFPLGGGGAVLYPYKGRLFVTCYYGIFLNCVDLETGVILWTLHNPAEYYWGHLLYEKDGAIVVGYGENQFLKISCEDAKILDRWVDDTYVDTSIRFPAASATSVLSGETPLQYDPINLTDGDHRTVWAEGVPGYGINERVQLWRDIPADIRRINILNSDNASSDGFYDSGRLKKIQLNFSDGQYIIYEVNPEKTSNLRYINLVFSKPVTTEYIMLTILDVFEGTKYDTTYITDITAYPW